MAGDGFVTFSVCCPTPLDCSCVGISTLDIILRNSRGFVSPMFPACSFVFSPYQGGGSPGELAEGPGVADLQRCWGSPEQSYQG